MSGVKMTLSDLQKYVCEEIHQFLIETLLYIVRDRISPTVPSSENIQEEPANSLWSDSSSNYYFLDDEYICYVYNDASLEDLAILKEFIEDNLKTRGVIL